MNIVSGTNTLNVTMVYTAGYGPLTGTVTDSVSGTTIGGCGCDGWGTGSDDQL